MAYKDEAELLFVRVPMSKEDKRKIDEAVGIMGMKKHEWIRRSLIAAADTTIKREAANG